VATVAQTTGFADQSHLHRLFKRMLGVTPGQYRQGNFVQD
jgi:AraC-like DNA-binding protein